MTFRNMTSKKVVKQIKLKLHEDTYNYFSHRNTLKNPYKDLFQNYIVNRKVLKYAYQKCKSENRNSSPGYDGVTIKDIETNDPEKFIESIYQELKSNSYTTDPLLQTSLPKKNNNYRNINIPTLRDKVVQKAFKFILEPITETFFYDLNYAYRPNRNIQGAVLNVKNNLTSANKSKRLPFIIKTDIENCFEDINQQLVLDNLSFIQDDLFMNYIKKFLNNEIIKREGNSTISYSGLNQGSVIAPLLSNIALHSLESIWFKKYEKPNRKLIRYSDDLLFMLRYDRSNFMNKIDDMLNQIGLTRNIEKTHVINLRKGKPLRYLGYFIHLKQVDPWNLYIAPKKEKINKLKNKIETVAKEKNNAKNINNSIKNHFTSFINHYRLSTHEKWKENLLNFVTFITKKYETYNQDLIDALQKYI